MRSVCLALAAGATVLSAGSLTSPANALPGSAGIRTAIDSLNVTENVQYTTVVDAFAGMSTAGTDQAGTGAVMRTGAALGGAADTVGTAGALDEALAAMAEPL